MISAAEAFTRLQAGNRRFVDGRVGASGTIDPTRREELVAGQEPFAIILGCADSRVPAEIVFDQGLGDLFVIRVAGNIVAPSQIGSVEFAAARFGTRLVVVLGHDGCGAIDATLDELAHPASVPSPNFRAIVDRVRPAIEPLLTDGVERDGVDLARAAVRANARASVEQLRHGSEVLERLTDDGLVVVAATYSLETGVVEFLDQVPVASPAHEPPVHQDVRRV
jgi:carbonic anhydrase